MVVDDDPSVRRVLSIFLPRAGFDVLLAAGGREAIDLCRAGRGRGALVLLDVRMPTLDGPATLAVLREIDADVRCCFMSASTGQHSTEELLALGALRFIEKPFQFATLAETLRSALA
jgi:DNA-binding NtrC family response regulator